MDIDLAADAPHHAAIKAYRKDIGDSNYSKAKDLKKDRIPKQEHKTKESCRTDDAGVSNSDNGDWAAYQTPEGYWYYFNNQTGESRWDPPEGFSFTGQQQNQQTLGYSSEQSSDKQTNEVITNDEAADKSIQDEHNGPFGKWETVAIYERNDDLETKQDEGEKVDKQDEVPVVKFKEKKLPITKQNILNDTNVIFKKRKSNQDKKRSIRQRTDDS